MKIKSLPVALLFAILPMAFAANPEDLYTQVGTDPTPAELIADGKIVLGEDFTNRAIPGSEINVNHALLQQQTGVLGPFSKISRVHSPDSAGRTNFDNFPRWYQEDGNTQVFRLFQGEHNYRDDNGGDFSEAWYANAPPSRVEAISPTLSVAPGTYRVWEGTYTIIKPLSANIFQLFHNGGDLWSFHIRMASSGGISFGRRNTTPGLPKDITIARNMVGKSIAIKIRANGYNYEIYKKIHLEDADWVLVTVGYYQRSPTGEVVFRWGLYPGSAPGATKNDGILFVSGAVRSVSTDPAVPLPADYYWDNNGATPGFGTAGGTWSATTTGNSTQGWSADETGATEPVDFITNTYDQVNFGSDVAGLAGGTITVSGAVNSGYMNFGSGAGAITLNGGSITMPDEGTITVAGGGLRTINSVIGGADNGFTVAGTGTLVLNGLNTFGGPFIVGSNVEGITVRINSIADYGAGASPSSLGAPTSGGLIQLGSGSHPGTLEFTGASAAASTNRVIQIGADGNGYGNATIRNNDPDADHTLTFSNPVFNVAAVRVDSSFSRKLTLGGSNTGDNTIAGAIIDNTADVGLKKSGTGTWVLAGASSYSDPTQIDAGTLKLGADNVLPSGAGKSRVDVNGGADATSRGTLDLNGFNLAINNLGGSTGSFRGRIVNNASGTQKTLTVGNNNASATFPGIIVNNTSGTGTIALTKVGNGIQTLSGPSTYTGTTTVSAGTLTLGANNVLSNTTPVSIGNGNLDAVTFDDSFGTLDAAGAATINLGAGANLAFANSSGVPWSGTLNLTGTFVSGSSLRFGTTSGGLTATQLALISASGFHSFALNSTGYLTATVVVPYATWKTTHAPTTGNDPNADEDRDSVANAIEFLLGGTIGTNDIAKLPQISTAGGNMIFTFIRNQASINGVSTVDIQVGDNLDDWLTSYPVPGTAVTADSGITVQKNVPSAGKDTISLTLPLNPGGRTFARLRVTP